MPTDSDQLRQILCACMPSIIIDGAAKESGQRVVYYAHFEDNRIPKEIILDPDSRYLKGWQNWGRVAVKVVAGASTSALTRLQAESALLNEIHSDQFPKLYYSNYFTDNPVTDEPLSEGLYVSVEEYIDSVSLSSKILEFIGQPVEVIKLALGVVSGLRPLWEHQRKLVHRDIKPDNLLIASDGRIIIIDFGIIRETKAIGLTKEGFGQAPASIGYAAPEHIANDKDLVSFKTDFFSLGVVMYELISGKHPFINRPNMDILELIDATEKIDPPTLFELGFANETQSNLVCEMMNKKPYLRPRTVDILIRKMKDAEGSK